MISSRLASASRPIEAVARCEPRVPLDLDRREQLTWALHERLEHAGKGFTTEQKAGIVHHTILAEAVRNAGGSSGMPDATRPEANEFQELTP